MKKKSGFTLAEILITLAVIGILATILLPAVKHTQPNKELVMVKKSYYNVSRIVGELINDEDLYPENDNNANSGFANVSIVDQIGEEARFDGNTFVGNSKFCGLFAAKLNTVQGPNDPNTLCQARVSLNNGGNFSTVDGVTWSMPVSNFASGSEDIYIDTDGPNKGPNCTRDTGTDMSTCQNGTGPDRFVFRISKNGGISIPSRIGQLYSTTSHINKTYKEFLRENPGIE